MKILLSGLLLLMSMQLHAAEGTTTSGGKGKDAETKAGDKKAGEKPEEKPWTPPQPKEYTAAQKKAECSKYEGRYIGFYDQVYKVEKCKRREIIGESEIGSLNLKHSVVMVEKETVAMLDEGAPIKPDGLPRKRSCSDLEGRYIVLGAGDIEFVEKCQRHIIPDVETLEAHRSKHKKGDGEIIELDAAEYHALKVGKAIPSILNDQNELVLNGKAGIDVIPVDEACRGVEGKVVSYYSKLYRVEKCRKREIDPEEYLKKPENASRKFVELSSEQWLSLPDGKPMADLKKKEEPVE